MKKTYAIINYGCQMNESDSEHYAGQLLDLGYEASADYEHADVVVINTCCVRENAEKKILGKIGEMKRLKRENPDMVLCVAGCMAQEWGKDLQKKYPQVDLVLGTAHVNNFSSILQNHLAGHGRAESVYDDLTIMPQEFEGSFVRKSSFAAWVPIMYGCNNFCTYCIVPYVRGRERSRSAEAICHEIEKAVALGYKEFTLLGQNVNSYRTGDVDFPALLKSVAEISPLLRVRFATSHPKDMSDRLIETMASMPNICRAIHLPAQSGSTAVLERMNRKYTREWYLGRVDAIRCLMPDCAITTDLIAGFCGETEEDHRATLSLMEQVGYDFAYMFKYSERPGTYAQRHLKDDVPDEVKTARLTEIINLQNELSERSNRRDVGKEFEILVEGVSKRSDDQLFGRTSQNKVVVFDRGNHAAGDYVRVRITGCSSATLYGEEIF